MLKTRFKNILSKSKSPCFNRGYKNQEQTHINNQRGFVSSFYEKGRYSSNTLEESSKIEDACTHLLSLSYPE
jgi:hypothetical protein